MLPSKKRYYQQSDWSYWRLQRRKSSNTNTVGRHNPHHRLKQADVSNANNNSLVIRIDYGKSSVLITGDLEDRAIEGLIKRYEGTSALDADVYVWPPWFKKRHYQSAFAKISPKYAVISTGDLTMKRCGQHGPMDIPTKCARHVSVFH